MMTTTEEIPKWLTKDLIKFALKDGKETEPSIVEINVERAVPKGNNFTGTVLRVRVSYTTKEKTEVQKTSLIMKAINCGGMQDFVKTLDLVEKEYGVYYEILPKIKEMIGEELGPKIYPSLDKEVFILEDLKESGYEMGKKTEQLTFEQAAAALTSVAKFHAASVRIFEGDPDFIRELGKDKYYNNSSESKKFMLSFMTSAINEIKAWPKFEDFHECLNEISETIFEEFCRLFKPKEGDFNVLNHGDFHLLNTMFKEENGKVFVKLIDFQGARFTSPSYDLRVFLSAGLKEHVRDYRLQELLDIYLKVLNDTLEKCGSSSRLGKEELLTSMEEYRLLDFYMSVIGIGLVTSDESLVDDFTDVSKDDIFVKGKNPFESLFKSSGFKNAVSKRLYEYEKSGLLKRCVKQ